MFVCNNVPSQAKQLAVCVGRYFCDFDVSAVELADVEADVNCAVFVDTATEKQAASGLDYAVSVPNSATFAFGLRPLRAGAAVVSTGRLPSVWTLGGTAPFSTVERYVTQAVALVAHLTGVDPSVPVLPIEGNQKKNCLNLTFCYC